MSSITDNAWAAGIIDGEGSIILSKIKNWNRVVISVTNTDVKILNKLKDLYGGGIYHSNHNSRPNHKQCWVWKLTLCEEFLRSVHPFLVSKKDKSEQGLKRLQLKKK